MEPCLFPVGPFPEKGGETKSPLVKYLAEYPATRKWQNWVTNAAQSRSVALTQCPTLTEPSASIGCDVVALALVITGVSCFLVGLPLLPRQCPGGESRTCVPPTVLVSSLLQSRLHHPFPGFCADTGTPGQQSRKRVEGMLDAATYQFPFSTVTVV